MKNYIYSLWLLEPGKDPDIILEGEKDLVRVRRVATGRSMTKRLKRGLGRKLEIRRDGKVMRGGGFALDQAVYTKWLEDNQPEET